MSVLQSKIFQAGVKLTNEELITLAKVEAQMRGDGDMAQIDADLERRLEANYQREKSEREAKASKGTPDESFGGLLKKI